MAFWGEDFKARGSSGLGPCRIPPYRGSLDLDCNFSWPREFPLDQDCEPWKNLHVDCNLGGDQDLSPVWHHTGASSPNNPEELRKSMAPLRVFATVESEFEEIYKEAAIEAHWEHTLGL